MVDACRHAALEELKPTRSQLERGFELHYGSYVADLSGCLYVADPLFIWKGDRLKRDLGSYRNKLERQGLGREEIQQRVLNRWRDMKAFESAFDPQWREDYRNLYRLAGMDLAVEDGGISMNPASAPASSTRHGPSSFTTRSKPTPGGSRGWRTWIQPGGTKKSPSSCTSMTPTGSP